MQTFQQKTVADCEKHGYVKTILKRRRYLPGIHSDQFKVRARAERQAVNAILQGSGADLMKVAMISIHNALKSMNLSATLLVQLHDELIFEVKEELLPVIFPVIKSIMEDVSKSMQLTVSTPVHVKVGKTWGSLKSYPYSKPF